jgi:hypothetical protein
MADFSKQWCDLNDPEMPHDFDIEKIASTLDNDYYKSYICEGFGFTAIGKDHDGKIILFFPNDDINSGGWKDYETFINKEKNREL